MPLEIMEILVTLDSIKNRKGEKEISFPEDTLVTKDARDYAAKNGIVIYVGDRKLSMPPQDDGTKPKKAIISVIGEDGTGIIAGISDVLTVNNVNILDITQTAIEGLFTMIAIVDISCCSSSFDKLQEQLSQKGEELKVRVDAQREDVFHFMHRV